MQRIEPETISTGIEGLDAILSGGLTASRLYMVQGTPGCGKTTLALQFLLEGVKQGETVLYLVLSETLEELEEVAASHHWDLSGITIVESAVSEENLRPEKQSTMFQATEMELSETTARLLDAVEKVKPSRVVFDSLSELRLLAQSPLRHRRQITALKRYFLPRRCTVLMLDDSRSEDVDLHLQTAAHGALQLEQLPVTYGAERRRLRVIKMRGKDFSSGWHDFAIRTGGLEVFPRLIAVEHAVTGPPSGRLLSGIEELDALMGGGVSTGTSTLVLGPAGIGKSTLTQQFAIAAAARGEHVHIFSFDESLHTMLRRAESLGMPMIQQIEAGYIRVETVDPGQVSPGEFADKILGTARSHGKVRATNLVIIDSLNGYLNAMPDERALMIQMHEMLSYLGQHGVNTFVVIGQRGIVGRGLETPAEATYLSDNALLLRFFEAAGEIKRAISVVKTRSGAHESTIREFQITSGGVRIGQPLHQFQGILTGEPTFAGGTEALMQSRS